MYPACGVGKLLAGSGLGVDGRTIGPGAVRSGCRTGGSAARAGSGRTANTEAVSRHTTAREKTRSQNMATWHNLLPDSKSTVFADPVAEREGYAPSASAQATAPSRSSAR